MVRLVLQVHQELQVLLVLLVHLVVRVRQAHQD